MRDGIRNDEPWMDEVRKSRLLGIDFDISARHVFGENKGKRKASNRREYATMADETEGGFEALEPQAAAAEINMAATAIARMDHNDYGRPNMFAGSTAVAQQHPQFFYHAAYPGQQL